MRLKQLLTKKMIQGEDREINKNMLEEHVVPNWLEEHITRSNRDKAVAEKSGKLFISYMIHADSKRKVGFS